MWHWLRALQLAAAVPLSPLLIFLLSKFPQHWLAMLFNGQDHPQNCLFLWRILTPSNIQLYSPYTYRNIHGSLDELESTPKRHLDRFSRFARLTNVTNKQTDKHADHVTPSVATGLISCTECMLCGLIITSGQRILAKGRIAEGAGFSEWAM